jgi:acid phosphatase (class A)
LARGPIPSPLRICYSFLNEFNRGIQPAKVAINIKKVFMKLILFLLLSLNLVACGTGTPAPNSSASTASKYADPQHDLMADIKSQFPDFPQKGSAAQSADEAELRKAQKTRSSEDCKRASSEVIVTLQNFYGRPYGELTEKQVATLEPFFEQIRSEFGPYIGQVKKGYARLRPYLYIKDLKPCVQKEESFAYPSGHATLAAFYGLILADLFPARAQQFRDRADTIARDRVIGGVHHPSDVEAGKKLGQMLYAELAKSKRYQEDVAKYRKTLEWPGYTRI